MFFKKNQHQNPSSEPQVDSLPRLAAGRKYFVESVDYHTSITYCGTDVEIGAMLLIDPVMKKDILRFGWKFLGINDTIESGNAFTIASNLEKLLADLPSEQPLKIQMDCFADDRSRQAELLGILAKAPPLAQKILIEEIAAEQQRHLTGVAKPRNITIWADYTPLDRFEQDEGIDRQVTQLTQFANRIISKISKTADAIDRHQRDLFLVDAYDHFIQIDALLRSRLGATDIVPLKPNEPWQMCRAELNRCNDRQLGAKELANLQIAPQTIVVDLGNNEIYESITTSNHPAEELIRFPLSKPDINRDRVLVDGNFVGCFFAKNYSPFH
jgi:hypothetical protein